MTPVFSVTCDSGLKGVETMCKSFSEQMEEQLEPRPERKSEAEDIVSVEPKSWDHTGKHQEFHEHTQD